MKRLLLILSVTFTLALTSCSSDDSGITEPTTSPKYFKLEKVINGGFIGDPILYKNDEVLNDDGTSFTHSYPVQTNDVITVLLYDAGGEAKIIYTITKNGVRETDTIRATDTNIGSAVNSYTEITIN